MLGLSKCCRGKLIVDVDGPLTIRGGKKSAKAISAPSAVEGHEAIPNAEEERVGEKLSMTGDGAPGGVAAFPNISLCRGSSCIFCIVFPFV